MSAPDDIILYHGVDAGDARRMGLVGPGGRLSPRALARWRPLGLDAAPDGLHLGTASQALSRAGRRGVAIAVRIEAAALRGAIRIRDRAYGTGPGWRAALRRARRKGAAVAVYLNRHEGIGPDSLARIAALGQTPHGAGLVADTISDAAFLQLAPEARDSVIVIDMVAIEILGAMGAARLSRQHAKKKAAHGRSAEISERGQAAARL